MRKTASLLLLILLPSIQAMAGDTWPAFRGPSGQGYSAEKNLPQTWGGPNSENILWKSALPGTLTKAKADHNQSSPIVWKDRLFTTSACWPEGVPQTAFPEHHVTCHEATTGKWLWDVLVPPGPWQLKDLRGGYAAPTPCTDGTRVYALFGSSVLAALDFSGRLVWRREVAPFGWDVAIGSSPVLTPDAVLVLADGAKPAHSRLIALDPATGNIKWERKRPEANFNHTTPFMITVQGKSQLVVASSGAIQGLDPADGAAIWWAKNKGDVPTPAFGGGLVYCDDGRGGPGMAVDPTGTGDLTATHVRWRTSAIPEVFSSPIIAGDHVYRTHHPGILKCFALDTGKIVFAERLPGGVTTSASPVVTADGLLYFASGGKSAVMRVGPWFVVLATNDLSDGSAASPAIAHGRLYIKGGRYLYCIGKPGVSP